MAPQSLDKLRWGGCHRNKVKAELTRKAESDKLMEWQGLGWIYGLDVLGVFTFEVRL